MKKLIGCVLALALVGNLQANLVFDDGNEHEINYIIHDNVSIISNTTNGNKTKVTMIEGAELEYVASVSLSGILNIEGGRVDEKVTVGNKGLVEMSGGSVGDYFQLNDHAILNWSGGSIGDYISAYNYAKVFIYGSDFNHAYGEITAANWNLTGKLSNGDAIAIDLEQYGDAEIHLIDVSAIPEPATLGLLTFGALAVIRRKRKA